MKPKERSIEQLKQLSIKEVTELLGYSYSTVHRMIERGELAIVSSGKMKRVPLWAIEDWQRRNSSGVE
jgi:excisionase family DNA binding protein